MSEEETLKIIRSVSRVIGPKFKFPPHENEDMIQYGIMIGIQGLEDYDPDLGSLKSFLYTHIRNRLFNFKRDNFERPDKPCLECVYYDSSYSSSVNQCIKFDDKTDCCEYHRWYLRNSTKRNITNPIELYNVRDEQENGMKLFENIDDNLELRRAIEVVDQTLPISLRPLWVKLKNEIRLNKADKNKLFPVVRKILEEEGINGA